MIKGLSSKEAEEKLKQYGFNIIKEKKEISDIKLYLSQFKNPFMILLIFATILAYFLGDKLESLIILFIIIISTFLTFWQERSANKAIQKLLSIVKVYVNVIRDNKEVEIPIEYVVPEDIVVLRAGDIVPADGKIIESKDLFINEALLTGEPYPVEKRENDKIFMGTHVVSGYGLAVVEKTGQNTEFGKLAKKLKLGKEETEFERGLRKFGYLLVDIAILLVFVVFAVNIYFHRPFIDSLLFALSLAVGLSPSLLPAVITLNLSYGAKHIAKAGAIVKRLVSIENFGSMNVFCSDKTGTLTEGEMKIYGYKDALDMDNPLIAEYIYVNSFFETGYKNPIDDAIRNNLKDDIDITKYKKLDEIPYDFNRKRLSILVKKENKNILITKGAFPNIISISKYVFIDNNIQDIENYKDLIEKTFDEYSKKGFKVIAVSFKEINKEQISFEDENDMVFLGFLILFDPLKKDAKELIQKLSEIGVKLKILTGDNSSVSIYIANELNLSTKILTGKEIDNLSEEALIKVVQDVDIFAELNPLQKERVITSLRKAGNVVGYMGDGINDIAAMRSADVAISVNNAVDIAKETAEIVLLKPDLDILINAILEGRKTFINTMKYLFMQTSSNFGNIFSMAGASFIIPFLPLLPKQVLTQNLLTDMAVMSIPYDNVDKEWLKEPKRWNLEFIKHFMIVFGLISSVFDYITFGFLLIIIKASEEIFRSGWFLESMLTQIFVLLILRTRKNIFSSLPSKYLIASVSFIFLATIFIPYTIIGKILELKPLPLDIYLGVSVIVLIYLLVVEITKQYFYRKYRF